MKKLPIHSSAGEYGKTLLFLLKWLVLSILVGLAVGCAGALFGRTLGLVTGLFSRHRFLLWLLPAGGLLIVLLYRACRFTDDKGTNTVVGSIQESADIPFRMAPLIFAATTVTQLFGGSAGREGAALQLGGSIANKLGSLFRLDKDNKRIVIMCGMSACFSALFGTPMAAAIFALEVVSVGIMHYSALVPCVVASFTAHFVAQHAGLPAEVFPVTAVAAATPLSLLKIVLFAAAAGGVAALFCKVLHTVEELWETYVKNQYLRIFLAGCLIVVLVGAWNTRRYLGTGMGLIEEIFHTGRCRWYDFLMKLLFTAVCIGAGFKGGEIVPAFTVGAAFGCMAAGILGLPPELAAACGMVGLFCGVTNSPLASLLIAFELFGFAGMPYYLVTVCISYAVSGRQSLYFRQQLQSKSHTGFEDR